MNPETIDNFKYTVIELIGKMGYFEPTAEYHEEKKRLSVFVNDASGRPITLREDIREALGVIIKQIARKKGIYPVYVDINNYHANREQLILELAKAAARKANTTKQPVNLPPMNAYERRLVHVELSMRPDVQTESEGEGLGRYVVVRTLE